MKTSWIPDPELPEDLLDEFEEATARGDSPSIADMLPGADHPKYIPLLQEMIRIEMEHRFRRSGRVSVESYRTEWPQLFASPDLIAPLAFEEYRLLLQTADRVDPADYTQRYGIDTSRWPRRDGPDGDPCLRVGDGRVNSGSLCCFGAFDRAAAAVHGGFGPGVELFTKPA